MKPPSFSSRTSPVSLSADRPSTLSRATVAIEIPPITWSLTARWTLTGALLNVADVDAADVRGYPLAAREWRVGLRYAGAAP